MSNVGCHPLCACQCDQIACGCHVTFRSEFRHPPKITNSPPSKEKPKR